MARDTHPIGARIKVVMGVDAGKTGKIINKNRIKTDGQGVPMLDRGHYHPMAKNDRAIQYDDGTLDVHGKFNLAIMTEQG